MSTLLLTSANEVKMTAPKTILRGNGVPAKIHAAVTLEPSTPAEIAARVRNASVTAKRVKFHLEWWISHNRYYYRTTDGKYGYLGAVEDGK